MFVERLKARLHLALNDQELLRAVPTQRLRGARYAEDAKRRRDGVRPVEFSPQAVDDDDFADLNVASLDKLTGPRLQMFKFRRIVIDEWTYLNARTYIYVRTLKCSFRWTLSGTPPLDDFAGVHRMAAYIHVNLGIVDDAPGAQTHESIRSLREDRTSRSFALSRLHVTNCAQRLKVCFPMADHTVQHGIWRNNSMPNAFLIILFAR